MCVVSFLGDNFKNRIDKDDLWKKHLQPQQGPYEPSNPGTNGFFINLDHASKEEVAILRREVEQLKELLKGAIEYDKKNNEPHCEIDEKVALIKEIAKALGVDL